MSDDPKRPVGRPGPKGARDWPLVHARVQPATHEALAALAAEGGVAVSAYVAELVERHVRTQTGPHVARRKRREELSASRAASIAADNERRALRDEQ